MSRERLLCTRPRRARRPRPCLRAFPGAEALEFRQLLSVSSLTGLPPLVLAPAVHASSQAPATQPAPDGETPARIRHAYGFDSINGDGSGQTIAIIDAYNDPNLANDLNTFDRQFGVTPAGPTLFGQYGDASSFLTVVNQNGGKALPGTDPGWALETALDVEWAHAIAPGAKLLLVEANSASLDDLMSAVGFARNQPGVSAVSMSWGGSEFPTETAYDSLFTTPAGHTGITFVAAAGDDSGLFGANWPAASPNVLSVGGTSLAGPSSDSTSGEAGWISGGGGQSAFEPEPAYQAGVQQTGARATPDVAYNADPSSGFAVYSSLSPQGRAGWFQVGGTSAGAPQWAALVAIANQRLGRGSLDGASQTLPALYRLANTAAFHDVSSGFNAFAVATPGFDLVTGLGSPNAGQVITGLAGPAASPVGNLVISPPSLAPTPLLTPPAPVPVPSPAPAPAPAPTATHSGPQDIVTIISTSNPTTVVIVLQRGNQVVAVAVPVFATTMNLVQPTVTPPAVHAAPAAALVEVPPAQLAITPIVTILPPLQADPIPVDPAELPPATEQMGPPQPGTPRPHDQEAPPAAPVPADPDAVKDRKGSVREALEAIDRLDPAPPPPLPDPLPPDPPADEAEADRSLQAQAPLAAGLALALWAAWHGRRRDGDERGQRSTWLQ